MAAITRCSFIWISDTRRDPGGRKRGLPLDVRYDKELACRVPAGELVDGRCVFAKRQPA